MNPGRVLRNKNFARLFFAGAASISGFSIGQVAINYLVFTTTKSSVDLAVVGVAFTVAIVSLSLFGGTLADRQDRRRLMIVCDAVRAASLALVAIALLVLGFNLWFIIAASTILGAFSSIFQPAERAMIPSILKREELADANGLIQLTASLAQAFANALGGALIVIVGAVLAIGLNSLTFLVSGLFIAALTTRKGTEASDATTPGPVAKPGFIADAREGIRYLVSNWGLLMLTVSSGIINLFVAMTLPFLVVYTTEILHGGATTYGIFVGLFALGAAPGALLVGRTHAVRRAGLGWLLPWVCGGTLLIILVLVPIAPVAFAAIFGIGVMLGFSVTSWLSIVQIIVPNEMQGRYFGVDQLGSFAVLPVGQIIGGFTIAAVGLSWTFGIAGAGIMVTALAFLAVRDLRKLGYPGDATEHVVTAT